LPLHTNHRKGLLITAIGGLVLSFDIPLIRLAYGDPWPILMLRTGTTFAAAFVIWGVWRALSPNTPSLVPGWLGAIVAALYGVGSIAFVSAVYTTSTANLVFILAFTTMFAALLSWIFLDERPRRVTLVTMAVMILGVAIIVFDGLGSGHIVGDAYALCAALMIAAAITISRHSGRDMGFTALVGVIVPLAVAALFVAKTGYRVEAPWWIVFNGAVVMPISFFCLANGPKYLSGAEVAMFYLLESVLAPVWVWLIFAEVPSRNALIGGTILIVALVVHSIWQLADGRRRTTGAVQYPL
jgi:drug/metabolite transporter (DMT)-like permease